MPYDRWGQTTATADALTGATLTDADLEAAEEEIVDALGWRPDPDNYGDADPTADGHDVRVRAFGRAVAWQAAHRADVAPSATDGADDGISQESIGDNYSVTRREGSIDPERATLAARTRTLLARAGWFAPVRSGRTHTYPR